MENVVFKAEVRKAGEGTPRTWRLNGYTPGVVYGGKEPPISIAVNTKLFLPESRRSGFFSRLHRLGLNGEIVQVIAKEIQYDPVSDCPIHVDFQRVRGNTKIYVFVPVHYINEDKAPGVKLGGMLNIIIHRLEVVCPADSIPDHIDVDLTGLSMGQTIHLYAITLPKDVVAAYPSRDKTLVTIASIHKKEDDKSEASA